MGNWITLAKSPFRHPYVEIEFVDKQLWRGQPYCTIMMYKDYHRFFKTPCGKFPAYNIYGEPNCSERHCSHKREVSEIDINFKKMWKEVNGIKLYMNAEEKQQFERFCINTINKAIKN